MGRSLAGPALKVHPSPEPSPPQDHFLPCLTHQCSPGPPHSRLSQQECERKMILLPAFAPVLRVALAWPTLHSPAPAPASHLLQLGHSGLRKCVHPQILPTPVKGSTTRGEESLENHNCKGIERKVRVPTSHLRKCSERSGTNGFLFQPQPWGH